MGPTELSHTRQSAVTSQLGSSFQECAQLATPRRMPQLAKSLGFDLPNALAGDGEALADLFERVLAAVADAEPHLDHLLLARRERLQHQIGRASCRERVE